MGVHDHRRIVDTSPELAARVIFVTGGVFTPDATAHLSKVDNLRLEKPLDTTTFRKVVNDLITSKREQPTS